MSAAILKSWGAISAAFSEHDPSKTRDEVMLAWLGPNEARLICHFPVSILSGWWLVCQTQKDLATTFHLYFLTLNLSPSSDTSNYLMNLQGYDPYLSHHDQSLLPNILHNHPSANLTLLPSSLHHFNVFPLTDFLPRLVRALHASSLSSNLYKF